MFYLHDLYTGKIIEFSSKQALLWHWKRLIRHTVCRLNPITGHFDKNLGAAALICGYENKDIHWAPDFTDLNLSGKDFYSPYIYAPEMGKLKRYMVLDQDGHSVDIRMWTKEINEVSDTNINRWHSARPESKNQPRFRMDPCGYGRKDHHHRVSAQALMFSTLRREQIDPMEEVEITPIRGSAEPRTTISPVMMDDATAAKSIRNHYDGSNQSWKKTKCGKQWAKHKKGVKPQSIRKQRQRKNIPIEGTDVYAEWHLANMQAMYAYCNETFCEEESLW